MKDDARLSLKLAEVEGLVAELRNALAAAKDEARKWKRLYEEQHAFLPEPVAPGPTVPGPEISESAILAEGRPPHPLPSGSGLKPKPKTKAAPAASKK